MNSGRRTLWIALVWVLIPFTLGAGLPQIQCRCAAAKGQRWCECCFQNPSKSQPETSPEKPCCQRRLAKLKQESSPSIKAAAGCQTCQVSVNPTTGSCCDLKGSDAPPLSKQVNLPAFDVSFIGLPSPKRRTFAVASRGNSPSHEFAHRTLDRVVVFAHWLI